MRLKDLEASLQPLSGFTSPKVEFEQYVTSAHLASRILFTAQSSYHDIQLKSVLDLGCGCGILSVASSLLGSAYTLGVDIDPVALSIAQNNLKTVDLEDGPIDFVRADLQNPLFQNHRQSFDTVVMNPPFGTKTKGIDMVFLETACWISKSAVYSLHKTSTRAFIQKKVREWGFKGEVLAEMKYDLPKTLKMHKHKTLDIAVDFWRFERIQGSSR